MNMNSLSKNIGAAARQQQQLTYRTATPEQKTEFFNKLHYSDTPLWLNSSLAEYYEQPLDTFEELYCGFLWLCLIKNHTETFKMAAFAISKHPNPNLPLMIYAVSSIKFSVYATYSI